MTTRTVVLFAATLLISATMAEAPSSAASLGDPASLNARAPDSYKAKFVTSKGTFVIQVNRDWAPHGADRFYNLVKAGFYNDARFFRVIDGFMVQFGISGNPDVSAAWSNANIPDDPVRESNARGTVTFATAGPNTRTTQVFINFNNNAGLNSQGFAPFGKVISGMDVVDSLYKGYGEGAPRGNGPNQALIKAQGNAYLVTQFPKLDYIQKATIE
ncbi:peptidylprolyl isomerase [Methyloceanibacter caenitepidi]|uniref:Peptidyl-prolyl cis-trans isomerase n=1 Tax=Methyloceanibacter caenitepidi TaxID=1384459 RepID=A0A0A8K486_9HYPH|nr:peptidylprolyl isomerase [Methyloceanibacter caenitepidi]BAQ17332.1 peptidyl-prolyl cis-trans isomerase PpiA precursor [Methyloceanibacter caenitepidi]